MQSTRLRALCAGIVLALLAYTASAAADEGCGFTILQPGGYESADQDDFDFAPKGWLALVVREQHWELVTAKVSLENWEVRSSDQPKAIAYLHDRRLLAGRAPTPDMKFSSSGWSIATEDYAADAPHRIDIAFGEKRYQLHFAAKDANGMHHLVLSGDGASSVLDDDPDQVALVWAGDLDHDGRLDLITNVDHEDGKNAELCLYLSSAADKSRLVKQVGCQFFSG
jgi:hypothetical protein